MLKMYPLWLKQSTGLFQRHDDTLASPGEIVGAGAFDGPSVNALISPEIMYRHIPFSRSIVSRLNINMPVQEGTGVGSVFCQYKTYHT